MFIFAFIETKLLFCDSDLIYILFDIFFDLGITSNLIFLVSDLCVAFTFTSSLKHLVTVIFTNCWIYEKYLFGSIVLNLHFLKCFSCFFLFLFFFLEIHFPVRRTALRFLGIFSGICCDSCQSSPGPVSLVPSPIGINWKTKANKRRNWITVCSRSKMYSRQSPSPYFFPHGVFCWNTDYYDQNFFSESFLLNVI